MPIEQVAQEEIAASEAIKKEQRKDPEYRSVLLRFIESLMMASSGGSYENVLRDGEKGTFLGAYGIPSSQWSNWATAAGYPGASWKDPRAQDAVARWAAQRLYNSLGDWGLVSIAWRYGTDEAFRFKNKFGSPNAKNVAEIWDEAEGVFLSGVLGGMAPVEDPGFDFGIPQQQAMGDMQLRFTMEQGEDVLQPQSGVSRAHSALTGALSGMADQVAGGNRLAIEDVEITQLGDDAQSAVTNVTEEDVVTPNG